MVMISDWTGFYGPSFRSLLGAARGEATWDSAWAAATAHHQSNPMGEAHWEFLATAYLHLVDNGSVLSASDVVRLIPLVGRFQHSPRTHNWRMMQVATKRRLDGGRLVLRDLREARVVPCSDGFLPDDDGGDRSTQYHAYILLLLLRFGDPGDSQLKKVVLRAFQWLMARDAADGDPSAVGRGRFQLFGYASMAAAASLTRNWGFEVDAAWHGRVVERGQPSADGILGSMWSGPHREYLLHGYNNASDYSAFAELWSPTHGNTAFPAPRSTGYWWHPIGPGSGLAADGDGVRVALLARSISHPLLSARALVDACHRKVRSPKRTVMPIAFPSDGVRSGGFKVIADARKIIVRSEAEALSSTRELRSPIIWAPAQMAVLVTISGCVETERYSWRDATSTQWIGTAFRLIRRGEAVLECAL
jgi:hypothetical protein